MRWIVAPLMMVAGMALLKYAVPITTQFTGPIEWAEKNLRPIGGTFGWWKVWGLFFVLFGLAWLTGVLNYNPNSTFQLPK